MTGAGEARATGLAPGLAWAHLVAAAQPPAGAAGAALCRRGGGGGAYARIQPRIRAEAGGTHCPDLPGFWACAPALGPHWEGAPHCVCVCARARQSRSSCGLLSVRAPPRS